MADGVTFEQIRTGAGHDLIFFLYDDSYDDPGARDSPFKYSNATCDYYDPEKNISKSHDLHGSLSYLHLNCRGLSINWDGSVLDHRSLADTRVRISAWAYLKGVSSLSSLHYLWRSLGPFSLPCALKWA